MKKRCYKISYKNKVFLCEYIAIAANIATAVEEFNKYVNMGEIVSIEYIGTLDENDDLYNEYRTDNAGRLVYR